VRNRRLPPPVSAASRSVRSSVSNTHPSSSKPTAKPLAAPSEPCGTNNALPNVHIAQSAQGISDSEHEPPPKRTLSREQGRVDRRTERVGQHEQNCPVKQHRCKGGTQPSITDAGGAVQGGNKGSKKRRQSPPPMPWVQQSVHHIQVAARCPLPPLGSRLYTFVATYMCNPWRHEQHAAHASPTGLQAWNRIP
jgi:hypothetical protein